MVPFHHKQAVFDFLHMLGAVGGPDAELFAVTQNAVSGLVQKMEKYLNMITKNILL